MSDKKSRGKLQLEYLSPKIARGYDFYLLPKLLLDHEAFDDIDYGAKILYSFMLSRASLSATNADNFTDEQGRLYIIYTVEQVMDSMRCSNKTAIKMIKQLDDIGLIEKKRQGQGKPSIIYVKDFNTIHFLKCKKYTSESVNLSLQKVKDLHPSYNNLSEKNLSEKNHINQSAKIRSGTSNTSKDKKRLIDTIGEKEYREYEEIIKDNINYDIMVDEVFKHPKTGKIHKTCNKEFLDEVVFTILDTVCSKKETIRVGGENKPAAIVKSQLLKLGDEHIRYVYGSLQNNTTKVYNIRSYLLTTLYNAPSSMNNYYRQEVNHDLYGRWQE